MNKKAFVIPFLFAAAIAPAASPSIEIPRGDRITMRFPCGYPDGTMVDITGWELEASIRSSLTGEAGTNHAETAGAGGTNGLLSWSWDVVLAPGRYLMGFRWTTDDGITFTPLPRAPFTVLPSLLAPTNGETVAGAPPSRGAAPREWVFTSQISPTAGTLQSLAVNVGLRGPAGATGATGPQGPAGTNGAAGPPGPADWNAITNAPAFVEQGGAVEGWLWDYDVVSAQETTGTAEITVGVSGGSYGPVAANVWPIYTAGTNQIFGASMFAQFFTEGMEQQLLSWTTQANASGYFISAYHSNLNATYHTNVPADVGSLPIATWGGADAAKPSTVTNLTEIPSSALLSLTNGSILRPADTNGFVGYASLGTLAWSNEVPWALVAGEPTFLVPGDTNGFVKASVTNGLGGGGSFIDPNTNWWAVIRVDLGEVGGNGRSSARWSDFEVMISTNGFGNTEGGWGFADSDVVLRWTSTNSQMNGVPDYEKFSTNTWYPAVWGLASAPHDANYHKITALYRELPYTLAEWSTNTFAGNLITPRALTLAIRDSAAWFHPSNRLSAVVNRQSADGTCESVTNVWWNEGANPEPAWEYKVMPDWREIPIEWTYHDPRPRRGTIFTDGSWSAYEIATEHQQP